MCNDRDITIILVLVLCGAIGSCSLFEDPIDTSAPICQMAREDGSIIYGDKKKDLSLDDLLSLQKCGLAIHPNYILDKDIANHFEYPVPKILALLNSEANEYYRYFLIQDIAAVTESRHAGHRERLRNYMESVLLAVNKAIGEIKNDNLRKNSQAELDKLRHFFK